MKYKTNILIQEKFTTTGLPKYTAIIKEYVNYNYNHSFTMLMKEEFYKNGMLTKVVEYFKDTGIIKKVITYGFFKKVEQIINYTIDGKKSNIKTFSGNKMMITFYKYNTLESRIYNVEENL